MVLIYTSKFYRKRFSIFSLLAFFFWKAWTFSSFQRFLCWKSRNYSQQFSPEIFSDIYLSPIINYWGSIFTSYLTWGAFSLVCVVFVLFFFLSFFFFFFFYWYIPWQTLTIHMIAEMGQGIIVFLVFHFHALISSSRFLPFLFNQSICNYQTDSCWHFFSLEICILFLLLLMQLSRSYWLWHFKVTLWRFELISNHHPSVTKRMP